MNHQNITAPSEIQTALSALTNGSLAAGADALLQTLGYRSDRRLNGQTGQPADFVKTFPAPQPGTESEHAFLQHAAEARILFQLTDAEIPDDATPQARLLDAAPAFSQGNNKSFLFAAVQLRQTNYPRGQYAAFAREINKRIPIPAVVLFRTDTNNLVTLAFVHRRPNKTSPNRQVLGSVSLIREINPSSPHRAHLDILDQLSLPQRLRWMRINNKPPNFDGLLDAWLDALDTEELNRRFYRELFAWFERATREARFPDAPSPAQEARSQKQTLKAEEHVIRLITRLLFVWFIKEKGLVAEPLFTENQAAPLLKNYDRAHGDSYYRAILQNLFFATLNTETAHRRFSAKTRDDHRNFSVYRYQDQIADPDALLQLFAQTPFINGGLFDCLDSYAAKGSGGLRVDCFTDNPKHRAHCSVPNRLFFSDPDATPGGDATPGLINLFNRYKFTVEENTPAEQEVALDPELLGKVFENLLAAVNPETSLTARKETGSYYTPRPVVDYMADQALTAALAQKAHPDPDNPNPWPDRLRCLLDYDDPFDDPQTRFTPAEQESIIRAIAALKTLDPAVGSGAFPMGILHKLTLALRRLDPHNHTWEKIQREQARNRAANAFDTDDPNARADELQEISNIFEKYRNSDYGRKLYLIQNTIYGVDLQPIAAQIAKLRFFISLAIEQQPNPHADNHGIKPLPNLETRFVAADTLLALQRPTQRTLGQTDAVTALEQEIAANRERHFHANTRQTKLNCRQTDARLRRQLAKQLQSAGFPAASANQIAQWEPFDQNAPAAQWFDPEYMFGAPHGFDIVIGNPPYIQLQKDGGKLGNLYENAGFTTYARTGDIYQLFYEKGCQLLKPDTGLLAYITSNSWLKAEYGKSTRRWFAERHTPVRLLEMGKDVFEQAIVDASILIVRNGKNATPGLGVDMDRLTDKTFPPDEPLWSELRPHSEKPWTLLSPVEQSVMDKIEAAGTPLKNWDVTIYRGVTTGLNHAFVIDADTRQKLIAADPKSAEIIKPVLRGRDIQRWQARWVNLYLIYARKGVAINRYPAVRDYLLGHKDALSKKAGKNEWYELQASPSDSVDSVFNGEKLIWMDLTDRGRFAYDDGGMFCLNTTFMLSGKSLNYLCAVLNSKLITWFMSNTALNSGMGVTRWIRHTVEEIPIPRLTATQRRPLERLTTQILRAKATNPQANTTDLEAEIDRQVYALYALTPEEIAAVAGGG